MSKKNWQNLHLLQTKRACRENRKNLLQSKRTRKSRFRMWKAQGVHRSLRLLQSKRNPRMLLLTIRPQTKREVKAHLLFPQPKRRTLKSRLSPLQAKRGCRMPGQSLPRMNLRRFLKNREEISASPALSAERQQYFKTTHNFTACPVAEAFLIR